MRRRRRARPKTHRSAQQKVRSTTGRCEVTGKVSYRSRKDAFRVQGGLVHAFEKQIPYRCRHCGDWHFTRDKRRR